MIKILIHQVRIIILYVMALARELQKHEVKTGKTERRKRQTHSYMWKFQHSFL